MALSRMPRDGSLLARRSRWVPVSVMRLQRGGDGGRGAGCGGGDRGDGGRLRTYGGNRAGTHLGGTMTVKTRIARIEDAITLVRSLVTDLYDESDLVLRPVLRALDGVENALG